MGNMTLSVPGTALCSISCSQFFARSKKCSLASLSSIVCSSFSSRIFRLANKSVDIRAGLHKADSTTDTARLTLLAGGFRWRALETFKALGIEFVSLSEQVDTSTPTGKMVFTVLGAVAELERSLIVERVRAGLRNARAKGIHLGRPRVDVD